MLLKHLRDARLSVSKAHCSFSCILRAQTLSNIVVRACILTDLLTNSLPPGMKVRVCIITSFFRLDIRASEKSLLPFHLFLLPPAVTRYSEARGGSFLLECSGNNKGICPKAPTPRESGRWKETNTAQLITLSFYTFLSIFHLNRTVVNNRSGI